MEFEILKSDNNIIWIILILMRHHLNDLLKT